MGAAGRPSAGGGVLRQRTVRAALGFGVGDLKVVDDPGGEARRAVPPRRQLALEPADHHLSELLRARRDTSGESLVVQQLQQGRPGVLVAVVRSGGQEQPVLAVGGELADDLGAQRVHGVLAPGRGRTGVHLVHDQQVEGPRITRDRRQHVAQQPSRPVTLEPIDTHDQPREVRPRVGVEAAGPAQLLQQRAVDDPELHAELVAHLVAPLQGQPRRADDQHRSGPMAKHELLHDQPRLDRLAQADVVGDEEVGTGHRQRPHDWVELILLDLDAGAEGRLQHGRVRRGDRAPPHGVEEGVEVAGRVETARGIRQCMPLVGGGARLQLPHNTEPLVTGVVLNAHQAHYMGCLSSEVGISRASHTALADVGHHPRAVPDGHHLANGRQRRRLSHDLRHRRSPHESPLLAILPHGIGGR